MAGGSRRAEASLGEQRGRIEDRSSSTGAEGCETAAARPGRDPRRGVADRGFGDFWGHMLVAEGAAEAMIEAGAHPWDWAAPLVIVEEAGGRFTTATGDGASTAPRQ